MSAKNAKRAGTFLQTSETEPLMPTAAPVSVDARGGSQAALAAIAERLPEERRPELVKDTRRLDRSSQRQDQICAAAMKEIERAACGRLWAIHDVLRYAQEWKPERPSGNGTALDIKAARLNARTAIEETRSAQIKLNAMDGLCLLSQMAGARGSELDLMEDVILPVSDLLADVRGMVGDAELCAGNVLASLAGHTPDEQKAAAEPDRAAAALKMIADLPPDARKWIVQGGGEEDEPLEDGLTGSLNRSIGEMCNVGLPVDVLARGVREMALEMASRGAKKRPAPQPRRYA